MIVSVEHFDDAEVTVLRFRPEAYDAMMLVDLRLDTKPTVLSRDFYAVIAALCVARQASGQLVVEGRACSGHVAEEISRFFAPVKLRYENVSQQPVAIPDRFMIGIINFGRLIEHKMLSQKSVKITFSSTGVGAFFSTDQILIGSNLPPYLGQSEQDDFNSLLLHIAGALLLADDFYLGKIVVTRFWSSSKIDEKFKRTASLLNTIGIELIVEKT